MIVAGGLLGGHAYFLRWGVVQISLANFVIVGLMLALFVLALIVPFPGEGSTASGDDHDAER